MRRPLMVVWALLLIAPVSDGRAQQATIPEPPVHYDADLLPPSFHQSRRAAVMKALPENAVAVFFSAPLRNREDDVDYEYRQASDLYYLTGMTEPASVLLLAPGGLAVDGETVTELLMVPPRDPAHEVWQGRRFGAERAQAALGVQKVVTNDRFEEIVGAQADREGVQFFHLPFPIGVDEGSELDLQIDFFKQHIDSQYADAATLRRALSELRMVKTDEELALMQRAIDITVAAHREAMKSIEPGMHEYEAEALIEYVFKRNGAEYPGFPSIVGSGENSTILHYVSNRRPMQAGDVVVMDIGAEYHGYSADVTRTVPVNGTFSPEQKTIYELVLRAQQAGIDASRAGNAFGAPDLTARRVLLEGLRALGLVRDMRDLHRFFMHGTSHYLGLYVHDVSSGDVLVPGAVITVEPGLYISPAPDVDPKWWHIGVRIEDDVLITQGDPVVLSAGAPRSVAEIEALMQERGLGNDAAGLVESIDRAPGAGRGSQ